MNKFRLLISLVFLSVLAKAQDNSYLLYSFKGNVSVIENKTESKAKIGKILNSAATIKLGDGATATLICDEASMFSIKKSGSFALSQFKDSCEVHSTSVSANYLKYVWSQMTSHEGSPGSNRKRFMNTVGAVSRSVNNIWIDPRLDTVNYVNGDFPLSWKSYADAKEFEFQLFKTSDASKAPQYKSVVTKMKISIPSFLNQLKTDNTYYWTTSVKGEQNDELKVLTYVSKESFEKKFTELKTSEAAYESEAEQAYRLAFMLEDAHYLGEAYKLYLKAATLSPDVPLYRSTLMSFKKDYEIK